MNQNSLVAAFGYPLTPEQRRIYLLLLALKNKGGVSINLLVKLTGLSQSKLRIINKRLRILGLIKGYNNKLKPKIISNRNLILKAIEKVLDHIIGLLEH